MKELRVENYRSVYGKTLSLEIYEKEINKIALLSVDEEVSLAQRIRKGDQQALDKMVRANLRFVVSVAKQYQKQGLSLSDLINEGNVGLIKAAKRFDETKGFKFISYAVWWIRQSILQALSEENKLVRLPGNKIGLLKKIDKHQIQFMQKNEREATIGELREILIEELEEGGELKKKEKENLKKEIGLALRVNNHHLSLDAPFGEGESNFLDILEADIASPDAHLLYDDDAYDDLIKEKLLCIPKKHIEKKPYQSHRGIRKEKANRKEKIKETAIILLRGGLNTLPKHPEEIAVILGVSSRTIMRWVEDYTKNKK